MAVDVESVSDAVGLVSTAWHVEEIKTTSKNKKEILLHTCFFQGDEIKPRYCNCDVHLSFAQARNMMNRGWAGFLIFKRGTRLQENRKAIVATRAFVNAKAKSEDAMEHKLPLSIEGFLGYHMADVFDEFVSGLDKKIQNNRRREIAERKKEVSAHRHRVTPQGNAIDSDSSWEEMEAGNGVGQLSSRPDRNTGKELGSENNVNVSDAIGGKQRKSLPVPIDEEIGREEDAAWRKETKDSESTLSTGIEEKVTKARVSRG
jgi:hypothetical protein